MKTLYLQKSVGSISHQSLRGRKLYDKFDSISEESLLTSVVISDQEAQKTHLSVKNDFLAESNFRRLNPDFIYIEGGLFYRYTKDEWRWKLPRHLFEEFISKGAVIIIADVDINALRWQKALYRKAEDLIGGSAKYSVGHLNDDRDSPVYGIDQENHWNNIYDIICDPEKMRVSDWIHPVYDGVSKITVCSPCLWNSFDSILASGNFKTTATLQDDVYVDQPGACPFASVKKFGHGYVATITGCVSNDDITEYCPDNITWLTNIAEFLLDHSAENKRRQTSRYTSSNKLFISHRSVDKTIVKAITQEIGNQGIDFWIDEEQIQPSDSLIKTINDGLSTMTHFALFWSENCLDASWVEMELSIAVTKLINNKIPIFIIKLDETSVPSIIEDRLYINACNRSPTIVAEKIHDAIDKLSKRNNKSL